MKQQIKSGKLKVCNTRPGWISVEDSLPTKNGYYITWCTMPEEPGLIHYHKDTGWQNGFYDERVTHWTVIVPPACH